MGNELLKNECELLIWKVPRELRADFRIACLIQGSNMRSEILKFMKQYTFDSGRKEAEKRAGL